MESKEFKLNVNMVVNQYTELIDLEEKDQKNNQTVVHIIH